MADRGPADAEARPARRGPVPPRTVLAAVFVIILVALGLYAAAPWLLPVRITEGPLVQMATPDGVTLVWYTTRPADCAVRVRVDGQERTVPAAAEGRRHTARIGELAAAMRYPYEIRAGRRRLARDLALQTAPVGDQRCTFLVFGDSGRGGQEQYALAAQMGRVQPPPDFLVHTGDLIYPSGTRRRYQDRFFTPYRHLLARVAFWPCVGNHDVLEGGDISPYQEVFELPANGPPGAPAEANYWFDAGPARFAVVDSNVDEGTLRDRTAPWLREVLSATEPRWRFVVLHHPPYTAGKYRPDQRVQAALVPVFEGADVDVVFNGHDHNYQRTHPLRGGQIVEPGSGVVYIVTGAGGGKLYQRGADADGGFVAAMHDREHSFTRVTLEGGTLRLQQIAADGRVLDEVSWEKSE